MTELSIIIVNWNVRDLLRDCLRSIEDGRGGLDVEVIVVDSASADGSAAMVSDEFPGVHLIAHKENVGFPRGNNIGLEMARGDFLLLLNPDTVVIRDALNVMVNFLSAHPDVGVVGPKLLNADGSVQSSRRRFPTAITGFFESTWLERMAPGVLRRYHALDLPDDETSDVDWLSGACLMVPRPVYEEVGGMDEAFYMYSEELDWCRRIKATGRRIVYHPAAEIVHHYGKSSEQAITDRHINFQRAKLRYYRKYHGRAVATALQIYLLLSYAWQLMLEGVKGLLGSKRDLRRQRVRAYYNVLKTGLRPAGY